VIESVAIERWVKHLFKNGRKSNFRSFFNLSGKGKIKKFCFLG
jgi:hypothetical protein